MPASAGLVVAILAIALGVPQPRGCGGADPCSAYVEAPVGPATANPSTPHLIYLNRGGATLTGGGDNAAAGSSSVVTTCGRNSVTIPPAPLDDATWAAVVGCYRDEFARFNVQVVDQRPTQPGYVMVVFGGTGDELGLPVDVRGKAPLDSTGCQSVEGAVVFVFSGKLGSLAQPHCEVAAHETAHVFSVDHDLLSADTVSNVPFGQTKSFQDIDAPCGETEPRPCICGRPSQNSVQVLLEKLGPAPNLDSTPPTVSVSAQVERPGYVGVAVQTAGPRPVSTVSLTYQDGARFLSTICGDGVLPCIASGSTYTFTVAGARGTATCTASATDIAGNVGASQAQQVVVDASANAPSPVTVTAAATTKPGLVMTNATISSTAADIANATLYWTDARGLTASRALCTGTNGWSLPIQTASARGPRSFVVVATDTNGNTAFTPPMSVSVQ